uniref:Uncharacterized protein n=1 Tax=Catharus ustulatus TaxID=91951 RepID=A0A8C3UN64_CATUS
MLYYLTFPTPSKSENCHTQKENEEMTINNKHNLSVIYYNKISIHSRSQLELSAFDTQIYKAWKGKVQTLLGCWSYLLILPIS